MMHEDNPDRRAVNRAIDFLDANEALDLGTVPWETYGEEDSVSQIDYDALTGSVKDEEGADWGVPPDGFVQAVKEALGTEIDPLPEVRTAVGHGRRPIEVSWDTCAWYQPLHFFAHDWGIFIREECLLRLAISVARHTEASRFAAEQAQGVAKNVASGRAPSYWGLRDHEIFIRAAFILLFLHEHYHHRVECLGLRLHVVVRSGLYVPYFKRVYVPAKGSDDLLEEALANACMYLRLSEDTYRKLVPPSVREGMRRLLKTTFPFDPPGYRKAVDYLDQSSFDAGENRLQGWVRETMMTPAQPATEWDTAPRLTQSFFNLRSHIYSVVPAGTRSVLPTVALPASCSTGQMISVCRNAGYEIDVGAGKGSHIKLKKAGAPTIILPQRKDLSIGVIKNALSALGPFRVADLPSLIR